VPATPESAGQKEVQMRRQHSHVIIVMLAVACLGAVHAEAQGNWQPGDFGSWRFYAGVFQPTADSQYWDEDFEVFTGSSSSFDDLVFGSDYLWRTSRSAGVLFGGSYYDGTTTQAYNDWLDGDGQDISHNTSLSLGDLTASYVVRFGQSSVRPYAGAGGGFVWWRLREEGYFIDFADENLPIVFATYQGDGVTWELLALAGIDFRLSRQWSFFFEGRYRWADDELNGDFAGFGTIDLSGVQFAGGFSYNF
jgi:hypothetical protein